MPVCLIENIKARQIRKSRKPRSFPYSVTGGTQKSLKNGHDVDVVVFFP